MGKATTKRGKGITALTSKKSSWNQVDASPGKTTSRTPGVAICKKSLVTHSRSLSACNTVPKAVITRSSSVKNVAATSKIGLNDGVGEALAAGWRFCSRKVSKSKVVGSKSLGSTPRFPPPHFKENGGSQGGHNSRSHHQETSPVFAAGHLNSCSSLGQLWPWGLWKSCPKIGVAKSRSG